MLTWQQALKYIIIVVHYLTYVFLICDNLSANINILLCNIILDLIIGIVVTLSLIHYISLYILNLKLQKKE